VAYLKCRSSKKHDPFYVKYADSENSLVLADDETLTAYLRDGKKRLDVKSVIEQLEVILTKPLPRKEVIECLREEFNCSERFVEDYIKIIVKEKLTLSNTLNNLCCLNKFRKDRSVYYCLQPITEQQSEISIQEPIPDTSEEKCPF